MRLQRSADGVLRGIAIDFGRSVADRLRVGFEPIPYESTGAFTRSSGGNEWDITVVGTSPGAKKLFNFAPDSFLVDYVYLAGPERSFVSISEIDSPGIKVGASPNG